MTGRVVEVQVVGDAANLEAALGRASRSLSKFGGDADAMVAAQLQGGIRQREDLAKTAAAWQAVADSSIAGSKEQIIASEKAAAAMTQLARLDKESAGVSAEAAAQVAQANVQAEIRSRAALDQMRLAYQETAAAAEKGSKEQIVASRRAGEAAMQLARIDQEAATRSVAAADESGAAFTKAGAGAFGFAKQLAVFGLGFAGIEGIKSSIQTVLSSQAAWAGVDRAVKNARGSVQQLTPVLEHYIETSRKLGFEDNETLKAEAELVTAFGSTKKALSELSLARDVARSKNEDLATATQQLILLQEGNTRAAKQFGLALPDISKAEWEQKAAQDGLTISQEKGKHLYDELTPRIRDQARAFAETPAGKVQEFHAEIVGLEESIGKDLLPTVDHYLRTVDDWLSKSANEKRVTRDVEEAVHMLGTVLHDAVTATEAVVKVAAPVVHVLGGWKTALEAIIALKFASVISGWIGPLGQLIGSEAAAGAGASGLGGAQGLSGKLLGNLRGLARIGSLALGVDLLIKSHGDKGARGFLESLFGAGLVGFTFGGPEGALAAAGIDLVIHAFTASNAAGVPATARDRATSSEATKLGTTTSGFGEVIYDAGTGTFYLQQTSRGGQSTYVQISRKEAAKDLGKPESELPQSKGGDHGMGRGASGMANARAADRESHSIVGAAQYYGTGAGEGTYGRTPTDAGRALDCSAYVYEVFTRAGFRDFPLNSEAQWSQDTGPNWYADRLDASEAQPGDVVFYHVPGGEGPGMNHVGIVVSGSGSSAKVMQYYQPGHGSKTAGINAWYPAQGVKRFHKTSHPAGMAGTGSGSGSGTSPQARDQAAAAAASKKNEAAASAKAKAKTSVATISGANELPEELRTAITHAANMALDSKGLTAAHWLNVEISDLEQAKAILEKKLQGATGKQRASIEQELRTIETAIASTQKAVAGSLTSWVNSTLSTVEKEADKAFQAQTAAHIKNVLEPKYFQGVDQTGAKRLTPAEAELARMQAEDQQQQATSALTQAQQQLASDQAAGAQQAQLDADQKAIDAAQRQITEDDLATKATAERAKADADYAKAVAHYQAERAKEEEKLNEALLRFFTAVSKGTESLGKLADVLERFGLPAGAATVPVAHSTQSHTHQHTHVHHQTKETNSQTVQVVHHRHHHHHETATPVDGGGAGGGRRLASTSTHDQPVEIILEVDGRRLASVLAPRLDKTIRAKLS